MASGPLWFLGIDAIFDLLFFVVTGAIAILALRAYHIFGERKQILFASGFALLSLSHLVRGAIEALVYINEGTIELGIKQAISIPLVIEQMLDVRAGLVLAGLLLLVVLYLDVRNRPTQFLLAVLTLFGWLLTDDSPGAFHVLVAILIAFIAIGLGMRYLENRNARTLFIFIGFALLLCGRLLHSLLSEAKILYVAAYLVTFAGYAMIASRVPLK